MGLDQKVVNAIRVLSAEGVQKAKSGHPGMPMGAAAMAYAVWGKHMVHTNADPKWDNRDRFVLSSGHGSMLIYSLLHLFGYGLTMDDLKSFRQYGSRRRAIRNISTPSAWKPPPARSARALPTPWASPWRKNTWTRTSTGKASRWSTTTPIASWATAA